MQQVFHKIVSILMSFVVLFSTMSFTIDMHYCGDTLMDTAIFHKAKTCGMEIQKTTTSSDCSIVKKDCCKEEQIVVKGQDELKIAFEKLSFDQQIFVASFVYSYENLFEYFEENAYTLSEYPPPLIIKSIYKLDETYLI
ncbi:HYC_CC_PP family protein [Mariniflexile rhizosphaerae]|uniref:HYC_CC_PP family protein n=1 Tax=unclassified Mariniflexile TaxID=2643887 RepID=UPI00390C9B5D